MNLQQYCGLWDLCQIDTVNEIDLRHIDFFFPQDFELNQRIPCGILFWMESSMYILTYVVYVLLGRYPAWNGKIDSKNGMGFWDMAFIWQSESGVAEVLVPVWGGVIGKIKKQYENIIYHIILWILTSALDFLSCQMELQLVWILSRLNWSI